LQNFHTGNVGGHEVGGELNALKFEMKNLRERFNQKRFGQPGRAGNQAMAAGKERNQQLLDHALLADDDFGQFGFNPGAAGDDLFDELFVAGLGVSSGLHNEWWQRFSGSSRKK